MPCSFCIKRVLYTDILYMCDGHQTNRQHDHPLLEHTYLPMTNIVAATETLFPAADVGIDLSSSSKKDYPTTPTISAVFDADAACVAPPPGSDENRAATASRYPDTSKKCRLDRVSDKRRRYVSCCFEYRCYYGESDIRRTTEDTPQLLGNINKRRRLFRFSVAEA